MGKALQAARATVVPAAEEKLVRYETPEGVVLAERNGHDEVIAVISNTAFDLVKGSANAALVVEAIMALGRLGSDKLLDVVVAARASKLDKPLPETPEQRAFREAEAARKAAETKAAEDARLAVMFADTVDKILARREAERIAAKAAAAKK